MESPIKVALLDMNAGVPNKGTGCIKDILNSYGEQLEWQIFDVRTKTELPDTKFDLYISSGGPGNPLEGDGIWDTQYYSLLDELWAMNKSPHASKKFVFFICHSYQMACNHFQLGEITQRRSMSFGTFPVHKTKAGKEDALFKNLKNPFCIADFRDFQLIQPDEALIENLGAKILLKEKIRPHVDLERAIMGIRFSEEFVGVQFHPEADGEGMLVYFQEEAKRKNIIENHGLAKYQKMIKDLSDPTKIALTHQTILPTFIENAMASLHN